MHSSDPPPSHLPQTTHKTISEQISLVSSFFLIALQPFEFCVLFDAPTLSIKAAAIMLLYIYISS